MPSSVSVIISTYNSSPFIIETLESVLNQTWHEIELIVSDDYSNDNTVEICRSWLDKNSSRFIRTDLLTSNVNTGVSANANRGLKVAIGEWVKFLGADDTLKPNCIEDNMEWLSLHHEAKVLFSKVEVYSDTFEPQNMVELTENDSWNPRSIMFPSRSAESQYRMLLLSDRIHYAPSVFMYRKTLLSVGGFDERLKLMEDYPLWLNLTKNGHRLYFMDKATVNYRRHSKAINNTNISYLISRNYFRSESFRRIYTYPYLPNDIRLNQQYIWYVSQIFRNNRLNRNKQPNRFILRLLTVYLNPFSYFARLNKLLDSNLAENEFYI